MEEIRKSFCNQKIERIFKELSENPFEGVGSPEQLKFNFANCWSRRINRKDRIIYQVNEDIITVFVISAKGHSSERHHPGGGVGVKETECKKQSF